MAAYQPIELPAPQGLNGMAEFFQGLRKEQDQRRQDAWNQMIQQGVSDRAQQELELRKQEQAARLERQRQADAEADQERLAKISEHLGSLHEAGLSHEASQLAQIYGLTQSVDQQPSGPRVGQLYDQQGLHDFERQVTQAPGETNLAGQEQTDHQVTAPFEGPNPEPVAPGAPGADLPTTAPQYTEHPIYHYQGKGGVDLSFDPTERLAAAQAQNARRAEQFRTAFTAAPNMQPYAEEFSARAQLGEDPKAIFADLSAREKADAAARQKALGEPAHSPGRFAQEMRLAAVRAAAAAANTGERIKQGNERVENQEANQVGAEMEKALAPVTDKKEGIAARQRHLSESLNVIKSQPENPVAWTNMIDGMIRTNTGRAAIKAQYDLYVAHAGGKAAQFDNWLEGLKSGNPGGTIANNILAASNGALAELQREGGEANARFHETYDADARVAGNPKLKSKYKALEHNAFSGMAGYGGGGAGGQKTAPHPKEEPVGATRPGPDGKTYRKVGPNNWQPVQQ